MAECPLERQPHSAAYHDAYGPSAANNNYWPEMYTNRPSSTPNAKPLLRYPHPQALRHRQPFDPELFGADPAKYHRVEVAVWLDQLAKAASAADISKHRRASIDIDIQTGLARFFAAKFRAADHFANNRKPDALKSYREARAHWARLAETARVYLPDVTVGELDCLRGHWLDRLPAIDADIADMEAWQPAAPLTQTAAALHATPTWKHTAAPTFRPGAPLALDLTADAAPTLHYRHLNQGDRWQSLEMSPTSPGRYRAEIPAAYTASPYHLQYYFSATKPNPILYPGLGPKLSQQPYFITEVKS